MKKFILLLPAFMLCSCVNAKGVSFKDNLRMSKPLSDEQVEKFEEKFEEQSKQAASLEFESVETTKEGFVNEKVTSKGKYTFYKNGLSSTAETKVDSARDGVKYNNKETAQSDIWVFGKMMAVISSESTSSESEFNVAPADDSGFVTVENMVSLLYGRDYDPGNLPAVFTNFTYFAKGTGFAVVYSDKQQDKVQNVGPGGKDFVETREKQLVISIDKSFKVTGASYFEETKRNRDNLNDEWYNSLQSVYKYQAALKVKYGSQSERNDQSKVYAELAKEDESYIVDVKPLLKMGAYDGTTAVAGASFTGSATFKDSSLVAGQFQGNFTPTSSSNAFLRALKAEVTVLSKDGLKTSTTENEVNINNMAALKGANTSDSPALPFWYTSDFGDDLRLFVNVSVGETVTISSASVYNA